MFSTIKHSYSDLFLYLKRPTAVIDGNQTLKDKLSKLGLILVLDLLIAAICVLLLTVLEHFDLVSIENHKIIKMLEEMSAAEVILAGVIVIPLIEELIFRLYLRYENNYPLRLFLSLFYITGKSNKERIEGFVKKKWYKLYPFIFYFSAVLFGFVHIFNFEVDLKMLLLFPIITAPQIFVGIFAAYLRINYSLIWGFLLHALHNLILFLPYLLFDF